MIIESGNWWRNSYRSRHVTLIFLGLDFFNIIFFSVYLASLSVIHISLEQVIRRSVNYELEINLEEDECA
jgi:hypothetical protein